MTLSDQTILNYIAAHSGARREDIRRHAAQGVSETTVWRALKRLVNENKLEVTGRGPATSYSLAGSAVVRAYLKTPYNRRKPTSYSKEFLDLYVLARRSILIRATDSTCTKQAHRWQGRFQREPMHAAS